MIRKSKDKHGVLSEVWDSNGNFTVLNVNSQKEFDEGKEQLMDSNSQYRVLLIHLNDEFVNFGELLFDPVYEYEVWDGGDPKKEVDFLASRTLNWVVVKTERKSNNMNDFTELQRWIKEIRELCQIGEVPFFFDGLIDGVEYRQEPITNEQRREDDAYEFEQFLNRFIGKRND